MAVTIDLKALLTPRQLEVATLTARGCSNREIASVLELSENTVKKHLKDVFAALDVSNRTELAVLLVRDPNV
jgi:DNA-binding NarL/FixJ family response regulator